MKIEIDDWRDVEGQRLGKQEASDSAPERDRERPEQRGHSSHHDWTKALQAALVNRGLGAHAGAAFGAECEVVDHDCVILDDANQQNNSEKRIEVKIFAACQ